jgi:hypothetical protein
MFFLLEDLLPSLDNSPIPTALHLFLNKSEEIYLDFQ